MTPVDSIKDVVRSSVKVPEFDKRPKCHGNKDEDNSPKTLNDKNHAFLFRFHMVCTSQPP